MAMLATFEELVSEAEAAPVDGWGFSWLEGRATEERPAWGYSRLLGQRMAGVRSGLDLRTGGGEVLAGIPHPPPLLVATESWRPNVGLAQANLRPLGGSVVEVAEDADLPFATGSFDLVASRHPTDTRWDEVARVLPSGGSYLSQQVGGGSNRELYEFMRGPQPTSDERSAERAAGEAAAAGLVVADLREAVLRLVFDDVGAIVYFLRKVVWTVPGFTVERYRDELRRLHDRIQSEGPFVSHTRRFLIDAGKPS